MCGVQHNNQGMWKTVLVIVMLGIAAAVSLGHTMAAQGAEVVKPMANTTQLHDMPLKTSEADTLTDTFGRVSPKNPNAGAGLDAVDTPKFVFGGGVLLLCIGAAVKLAVVAGVVFLLYHVVKRIKLPTGVANSNVPFDPIDLLVESFNDAVTKIVRERDRRVNEVERLDTSLAKLKKGVNSVIKEPTVSK